jgi:hypothetical protein
LITQTKFGKEWKWWSSSLCSFPQPSVTSFLLGRNVPFSTPFSDILSVCSSHMWETKFHSHTKQLTKQIQK